MEVILVSLPDTCPALSYKNDIYMFIFVNEYIIKYTKYQILSALNMSLTFS